MACGAGRGVTSTGAAKAVRDEATSIRGDRCIVLMGTGTGTGYDLFEDDNFRLRS